MRVFLKAIPYSSGLKQACFRFVVFQLKRVVLFLDPLKKKGGCWAFSALQNFLAAVMV
jgi:hypothetical protein